MPARPRQATPVRIQRIRPPRILSHASILPEALP
jgi:hypothetical protein